MTVYDYHGNAIEIGGGGIADSFFNISYPTYSNKFNPNDENIHIGYKLASGGNLIALSGSITTDYIGVDDKAYVYPMYGKIKVVNPNVVYDTYPYYTYFEFYDANKSAIAGTFNNEYAGQAYTIARPPIAVPNGAKYIRLSFNVSGTTPTDFSVAFGNTTSETIPYEVYYSEGQPSTAYLKQANLNYTDGNALFGKNWVLFGDSLTDAFGGHDWQKSSYSKGGEGWTPENPNVPWTGYFFASKIAREFGLHMDNRAKSGSNIETEPQGQYTSVNGCNMLDAYIAEVEAGTAEAPDIITIAFGTNTFEAYVGDTTNTSADKHRTCGAVKYFIETIREKFPNAVFGFVLPPVGHWDSTIRNIDAGRAAIKSVLELDGYKVPYIDMSIESGITVAMLPDEIHISSKQANNLYYHAIRRFVLGL